jgi:hypothetical protein
MKNVLAILGALVVSGFSVSAESTSSNPLPEGFPKAINCSYGSAAQFGMAGISIKLLDGNLTLLNPETGVALTRVVRAQLEFSVIKDRSYPGRPITVAARWFDASGMPGGGLSVDLKSQGKTSDGKDIVLGRLIQSDFSGMTPSTTMKGVACTFEQ